jgi:ferredoxin--NADP+ reductase
MSLPGLQLKGDASLIVEPPIKDRALTRKLDLMRKAFQQKPSIVEKVCHFDFYQSPTAVISHQGQITGFKVEKTELVDGKVKGTGNFRTIDTGIVFRSIGLQNEPIEELGFDSKQGIIPNIMGRVIDSTSQEPIKGIYVAGWAKTGPKGVLLSTMSSSQETAECLVQDLKSMTNIPTLPTISIPNKPISFEQWQKIDREEVQRGQTLGKSRVKMRTEKEMLDFIHE